MALLGGGLLLAPSCTVSEERVSIALNNLNVTGRQEQLLSEVTETFIPTTDTPGAQALNIHHFVLVMVDDCRNEQDQKAFVGGLDQIEQAAKDRYEASFSSCTASQKEEVIAGLMGDQSEMQSATDNTYQQARQCLSMTKRYTIQGFLQSEYVMTNELPYQLVPGHFNGCVPLEQKT
ncbi:Gluconate 2-dehydrogenase subunit 3 [Fodinibius sediminis]|uniref:Gluconate 2-dehydrogenase subunit 3 n=2 Tax=Fodinibius sediminis TaxID=1214077 RepID=A0A521DNV6_9BACT|nr:Gluconate 2-dehydrogenase subunit 3 [Fodinibius sediminis]